MSVRARRMILLATGAAAILALPLGHVLLGARPAGPATDRAAPHTSAASHVPPLGRPATVLSPDFAKDCPIANTGEGFTAPSWRPPPAPPGPPTPREPDAPR